METAFWRRFTSLCEKKGVTPNKVMLQTGLNTGSPTQWKQRGIIPRYGTIVKLARYFDVSPDYMIGADDNSVQMEEAEKTKENKAPDNGMSGDELLAFALYGMEYKSIPKEKLAEIRRYADFIKDK